MWENIDVDRHYTGVFQVLNEHITGELIYNKQKGVILLNLVKEVSSESFFGKSYGTLPYIIGKLNSGAVVTLFNNKCSKNHTYAFSNQRLIFISDYMVWSNSERIDSSYNKMVCTLKNAYPWSGFSTFEETEDGIKAKNSIDKKTYNWFGAKITFSSYVNNPLFVLPTEEETKIVQRLVLEIETIEKSSVKELVSIRDKIMSLISFAIKNNVNIEEQYLYDYDDVYLIANKYEDYHKHYLYTSGANLDVLKIQRWHYNFSLKDLPEEADINDKLEKLTPVFNLYLSLFKYKDMPHEMVFLNIVQALETFHSRFFYGNKKDKYVDSVKSRFGDSERYNKLLLNETQMDKNCNFIILVSRLNDLLIGKNDGLFCEYYIENEEYAQTIADTRHYYTHYGKSKEAKALKGEELLEAIYILRVLLEYHICLSLGIDRRDAIAEELNTHNGWKLLSETQGKSIIDKGVL
ncbi:MAG: hypothetical protein IKY90_08355 [Oscillospiraceae bacterium]|nr:hypothetical protein [Oscillospiraceae bacterium]